MNLKRRTSLSREKVTAQESENIYHGIWNAVKELHGEDGKKVVETGDPSTLPVICFALEVARMTHIFKRHGATALFDYIETLGRCNDQQDLTPVSDDKSIESMVHKLYRVYQRQVLEQSKKYPKVIRNQNVSFMTPGLLHRRLFNAMRHLGEVDAPQALLAATSVICRTLNSNAPDMEKVMVMVNVRTHIFTLYPDLIKRLNEMDG